MWTFIFPVIVSEKTVLAAPLYSSFSPVIKFFLPPSCVAHFESWWLQQFSEVHQTWKVLWIVKGINSLSKLWCENPNAYGQKDTSWHHLHNQLLLSHSILSSPTPVPHGTHFPILTYICSGELSCKKFLLSSFWHADLGEWNLSVQQWLFQMLLKWQLLTELVSVFPAWWNRVDSEETVECCCLNYTLLRNVIEGEKNS